MKTLEDQVLDEFNVTFLGPVDVTLLQAMTDAAFCPVTVAGSLHTIAQVETLFRETGVEKVVVKDDNLGALVARRYGAQAAVYPVDYRMTLPAFEVPWWAGELLLTSIDRDGMGVGFDLDAMKQRFNIPVVYAGGCGKLVHVKEAFDAGAAAVCVSSMFAFTDKSPIKLRTWLISEGANVRRVG